MTTQTYMTLAEVAEVCRTTPDTVRYWRHIGKGPKSFKVGGRVLYVAAEVHAWIEQMRLEQQTGDVA